MILPVSRMDSCTGGQCELTMFVSWRPISCFRFWTDSPDSDIPSGQAKQRSPVLPFGFAGFFTLFPMAGLRTFDWEPEVDDLTKVDWPMYREAVKRFIGDLGQVELEFGTKILCHWPHVYFRALSSECLDTFREDTFSMRPLSRRQCTSK